MHKGSRKKISEAEAAMHSLRSRIFEISQNSRMPCQVHWACWRAVRTVMGDAYNGLDLPPGHCEAAFDAVNKIGAAAKPKLSSPEVEIMHLMSDDVPAAGPNSRWIAKFVKGRLSYIRDRSTTNEE